MVDRKQVHQTSKIGDRRWQQRRFISGSLHDSAAGIVRCSTAGSRRHDMLRFHKFTIGWAWTSEYGSPENPEEFSTIYGYSPLHNLKPGMAYPATMITTADHDDRVVPAHSFKFASALQEMHAGEKPVLIRIETKAGHGAGKPTAKIIEELADEWAFLVRELDIN